MLHSFVEMIGQCNIFDGCCGMEAIPADWKDEEGDLHTLYVFGYGSVVWKPGIEYADAEVGHISGFIRRMWQGNETHRGTKEQPGRVATLIPKENKKTFGKAFILKSKEQIANAMEHLVMREISLGGYCLGFTDFFAKDGAASAPVPALVFSATTDNEFYLGPEKMRKMAKTVADSRGPSGHNIEYLVKLCDFMRAEWPTVTDNHLFDLEKKAIHNLRTKGLNYKQLAYPELFPGKENLTQTQTHSHPPPALSVVSEPHLLKVERRQKQRRRRELDDKERVFTRKSSDPHLKRKTMKRPSVA